MCPFIMQKFTSLQICEYNSNSRRIPSNYGFSVFLTLRVLGFLPVHSPSLGAFHFTGMYLFKWQAQYVRYPVTALL